jgi:uncharacterized SAM-binding protein YcdF (DUF218 family)
MKLNHGIAQPDYLSDIALVPPAFRLFHAIRKTQPAKPAVGVCLEGDTTLRLMTTAALYRAGAIYHVIVSGGVEEDDNLDERPAAKMREFLITKGIPEEVIDVEQQSRTTHDHPLFVNAIAKQRGATDLMIITSGYHLLRAYLRFLKKLIAQDYPFALYGYPAGSFKSWFQKIPTGGPYRILHFLGKELTKIRTYEGLATFDEAWHYIRSLKTSQ